MTATMAAKDTNQLTRTKPSATNNPNMPGYASRRQPFYQQPSPAATAAAASASTLAIPTTAAAQQEMTRAINIGFTGYTHAYLQHREIKVNERMQRNEVTGGCVAAPVITGIDAIDDDDGNVDGNGNVYRDSEATMATNMGSTIVGVDAGKFAVGTRTGAPVGGGIEVADVGDDSDSFASMETLSDNVAVWVDGEKHWVAGVDVNTTCTDLICALLNYQNAQQLQQKHCHQYMFNVNNGKTNNNTKHNSNSKTSNSNSSSATAKTAINPSALIKTSTNTKENCDPLLAASVELTVGGCYPAASASMALTVPATSSGFAIGDRRLALASEYVIVKHHRHCEEYLDGNARVFDVLPANDGPSRKECELLLRRLAAANSSANITNSNAATFSAPPGALHRPNSPSVNLNTQVSSLLSTDKDSGMGSPVGSSRSARLHRRKYKSAATVSWLAQANTLHPRVSQRAVAAFSGLGNTLANTHGDGKHIAGFEQALGEDGFGADALDGLGGAVSANERLLKIILAQDETIHRQLVLLREKERQISKIEEEKHRVRQRELGKNYLLETYLNGLDDGNVEPDLEVGTDVGLADSPLNEFNEVRADDTTAVDYGDGNANGAVEIYIDEPYQRTARTNEAHTRTAATTTTYGKDFAAGKTRDFNLDARHSKKMKEDFTGGGDVVMAAEKIGATEQAAATCHGNEQEIDVQLFWLEKIYSLNKQLQREEETLLRLHANIRKHQVKRAYQTKREVLQQIEKLDAELTLQCCDIRAVESKLHVSNEQLKQKLGVLERLSEEFLETMMTTAAETTECGAGVAPNDDDVSPATVNRMPDVINNGDHNLATILHATAMARENKLHAVDELHAKQTATMRTEQLVVQQGCQLQRVCGEAENVWHTQDAKFDLPHATATAAQVLHADLNMVSEPKTLTQNNIAANEHAVTYAAARTTGTTNTTTDAATRKTNGVAASHASAVTSNLTATSCATPSSTTARVAAATTTAASACNMSAVSPAEGKQTTALHLPQLPHQGQQQLLPIEADDSRQCVDADDVLVDALAAVGAGAVLPQSNYPISCINHAAIHATSQLSTRPLIVAAVSDDGVNGAAAAAAKLTPEQILPPAAATLSAANLTTSASSSLSSTSTANTSIIQQQQQQQSQLKQQQQQCQAQLLSQRQQSNVRSSYSASNCVSNHSNSNSDKNLLPSTHAAHTKILQKQMFGPKSLNQTLSAVPPPKIILATAAAMTTPAVAVATTPIQVGAHVGHGMPVKLVPQRPTTPTATTLEGTTHRSGLDITQLGTLV